MYFLGPYTYTSAPWSDLYGDDANRFYDLVAINGAKSIDSSINCSYDNCYYNRLGEKFPDESVRLWITKDGIETSTVTEGDTFRLNWEHIGPLSYNYERPYIQIGVYDPNRILKFKKSYLREFFPTNGDLDLDFWEMNPPNPRPYLYKQLYWDSEATPPIMVSEKYIQSEGEAYYEYDPKEHLDRDWASGNEFIDKNYGYIEFTALEDGIQEGSEKIKFEYFTENFRHRSATFNDPRIDNPYRYFFPALVIIDNVNSTVLSNPHETRFLDENLLAGTEDVNTLVGTSADEVLDGKGGNDILIGGDGADVFVLSGGFDIIKDFDMENDSLRFPKGLNFSEPQYYHKNVVVNHDYGRLILDGVAWHEWGVNVDVDKIKRKHYDFDLRRSIPPLLDECYQGFEKICFKSQNRRDRYLYKIRQKNSNLFYYNENQHWIFDWNILGKIPNGVQPITQKNEWRLNQYNESKVNYVEPIEKQRNRVYLGTNGHDYLKTSGKTIDTLTGNASGDFFVFDELMINRKPKHHDHITDFSRIDGDIILFGENIWRYVFSKTPFHFESVRGKRKLQSEKFAVSTVIYESKKGKLYLDSNGSKSGFGKYGGLILALEGSPELDRRDFMIVADP